MSDRPQDAFNAEATELLQQMEDGLLALEDGTQDPEQVNTLFRAAHTIKGTAGVFGFDAVEHFTHVVENLLEQARSGELTIGRDLVSLLLRARDHMAVLVAEAVEEADPDPATPATGEALAEELRAYLDDGGETDAEPEEPVAEGSVEVMNDGHPVASEDWHISLRFEPDVLRHGMDPLAFLRYLRKLGEIIHVTTLDDALPGLGELDPEVLHLGFEVEFRSETADKAAIEEVFEFVEDDCELHILPPRAHIHRYADMIRGLPEDDLRIGEILVRSGALTQHELDEALREQTSRRNEGGEGAAPLGEVLVDQQSVHQEVVDTAVEKQSQSREARSTAASSLRVDADKLDALINQVGELVIAGATTNLLAQQSGDEQLGESISVMARLVEEIRDSSLRLRMVPIGETFNRFRRVVRDVSAELGKDIALTIEGADTELDKTVVEQIGDPLMHLVRNAMDHGIESAEERQAAGKPAQGQLRLNAYHESGSIVIEVADDGGGLNSDKILAKARDRGVVTPGQELSEAEIHRLIFEPGFSTAGEVTNLSGRGVGMDVVKKNIESLRGSVDVESRYGEGSIIRIRLPLTLAIVDGFLVTVAGASYVIPLDSVLECVELTDNDARDAGEQGYINLRGEVLPFIRLRRMFERDAGYAEREAIVVVQISGQKVGLVVDELLGEFQTVIKPLGQLFRELDGVSGATILGSGEVAMILDVPGLIHRVDWKNGEGRPGHAPALEADRHDR